MDSTWWRTAVIYQVYPRSFADSDGDGVGDLPGITSRLTSLAALGVDAVWLSPFFSSPQVDAGYDVSDYCDVDPVFGTLADLDALLARAHDLGLKVIVDLVPNHTSDQHPWFRAALADGPGSPARARYHFPTSRPTGSPCSAVPPGPGCRTVSRTSTCTTRRSPISTGPTRRCGPSSSGSCGSGSTAASTGSGSTSPTAWSRTRATRRTAAVRWACWPSAERRTGTRTGCTTSTGPGERSSTATRPPTRVSRGSCAVRPTWRSSGRSGTCDPTSCTRPSTSPTCRRRWSRWRCDR